MGYFSNGAEGDHYQSKYCERCVNWRDKEDGRGDGCAVWDVHLFHNYKRDAMAEEICNTLIPMNGIHNAECAMFLEATDKGAKT